MRDSTNPTTDKHALINKYLLPALGELSNGEWHQLVENLAIHVQLRQAIAGQYVDEPGTADEGLAVLFIQSVAHSFQMLHDANNGQIRPIGTHIWSRRTLIFNPYALLDDQARTDYVQVLEPGPYLSIRYPALRHLLSDYPPIERAITLLARKQERQRQNHDHLLRLPAAERVATFEKNYVAFARVTTIEVRCQHTGLTRQTYARKLRARKTN